ncbi:MAG: mandelate racemase/muconate lactonizing enzyme family protein [Gemmatimonadetes bacterium]|nr:mandelate racemase/muconate lactonizing enzyme family protein [Gemmatimonadota bacterium]MXY48513.1 mandelate racemase/muconate lactonizing enzyme family protein [Gemmatimonadota bacterium]MYG85631.1 mandelate racemase/muconate lactonizing enzyme family protein [Gemmatimonadota bacterium]MYJ91410.1 mandelate racemase/muconate lactonizing enzyme family protein [Gemmatimonadota bacterium]
MKITDLKCAVIGQNPVVRITTDEGIHGLGQIENSKPYMKPHVLFYRDHIIGQDPTDVNRVVSSIRRLGSFKPWGSAVSAIEMALWDIAGKAAGLPVYKLLGGKMRDRVRVYNGAVRFPMKGATVEDYAEDMARMKAAPEGFTIIKQGISFHSQMPSQVPDFFYGDLQKHGFHGNRGPLTEKGLKHLVACIEAMKAVLGDEVGLALDCGPGMLVPDALRLAKAVEHLHIMWLEDMITGDYTPFVLADLYREVNSRTSTPIHTGEQIYLRENFVDLIEKRAVDVVGPDPADVGGIAELKWIAEYADLHGVLMAPHGVIDGLIGLAALVHASAAMPPNYIAFEYPIGNPSWWYDIVEGLPETIVKDGFIDVWDSPGLGVDLVPDKALPYLKEEDQGFFD